MRIRHAFGWCIALSVLSTTACAEAPRPTATASAATADAEPAVTQRKPTTPKPDRAASKLPPMVVHKSPTCGCCALWVDHMREAGFAVEVVETDQLAALKERVGIPYAKGSCHTAEVGGYFVEGHVPAEDVKRLLREKPKAKGLVLPGMPMGSPGMEMPDGRKQPYTVELVDPDGNTREYAKH